MPAGQPGQTETCWTSWACFPDILWNDERVYLWITVWLIQYALVCMNPLWTRSLPLWDKLTVVFGGRSANLRPEIHLSDFWAPSLLLSRRAWLWGNNVCAKHAAMFFCHACLTASSGLGMHSVKVSEPVMYKHNLQRGFTHCCASALSAKQLFIEHVHTWLLLISPAKQIWSGHLEPASWLLCWLSCIIQVIRFSQYLIREVNSLQ